MQVGVSWILLLLVWWAIYSGFRNNTITYERIIEKFHLSTYTLGRCDIHTEMLCPHCSVCVWFSDQPHILKTCSIYHETLERQTQLIYHSAFWTWSRHVLWILESSHDPENVPVFDESMRGSWQTRLFLVSTKVSFVSRRNYKGWVMIWVMEKERERERDSLKHNSTRRTQHDH